MVDIDALRSLIEAERQRFAVPGVGVAVVAGGEVVLCDGFGIRDIEAGLPVTADTHFPIASDTKAFTAAMVCLLADEGRIDLDAPIRDVVPWFEMHDPHATALVSARDLLSHRTGLPRHDFVWYGKTRLTSEDVVRRLRYLPLSRQPRQSWQYNNLCYTTAGYVTEVLTGQEWSEAVRDRLLHPLKMTNTRFSAHDPAIAALARPYKMPATSMDGPPELQRLPEEERLLPAGGIVSTAEDMGNWLLARLGQRPDVLSDEALAQLHAPAMVGGVGVAQFDERQPMGYALGCQVEAYRGRRIIRHGGNLVGYSSDVCVIPGDGIGVVVLTNMHGTSLRDALALMIIDRLVGLDPVPWGERYHALMAASFQGRADALEHHATTASGKPPSRPLEEFAGIYEHPAYGTFGVGVEGGALVPDYHGLGSAVEFRHRDHDVWDLFLVEFDSNLPVVFACGPDGEIASLSAAFEPNVAPIVFTRAAPAPDAGLLDALPGSYEMGPLTLTIRRQGDRLVAKLPGVDQLVLRSAGGSRLVSPTMATITIDVERGDDGGVTSLIVDPVGIFTRVP